MSPTPTAIVTANDTMHCVETPTSTLTANDTMHCVESPTSTLTANTNLMENNHVFMAIFLVRI